MLVHGRDPERTEAVGELIVGAARRSSPTSPRSPRSARSPTQCSRREPLDVLVNNAGHRHHGAGRRRAEESADGYELRFAVNYLAPVPADAAAARPLAPRAGADRQRRLGRAAADRLRRRHARARLRRHRAPTARASSRRSCTRSTSPRELAAPASPSTACTPRRTCRRRSSSGRHHAGRPRSRTASRRRCGWSPTRAATASPALLQRHARAARRRAGLRRRRAAAPARAVRAPGRRVGDQGVPGRFAAAPGVVACRSNEQSSTGRRPTSRSSAAASPASAWPSACARRASTTSSCSSAPTTSAAPGATTRYPGCACDVPSHLYSFSFAPNPDWTRDVLAASRRSATTCATLRRRASACWPHVRFGHEVARRARGTRTTQRWQRRDDRGPAHRARARRRAGRR